MILIWPLNLVTLHSKRYNLIRRSPYWEFFYRLCLILLNGTRVFFCRSNCIDLIKRKLLWPIHDLAIDSFEWQYSALLCQIMLAVLISNFCFYLDRKMLWFLINVNLTGSKNIPKWELQKRCIWPMFNFFFYLCDIGGIN